MHIADRFPEAGLAPALGSMERGQYYQWLVYSTATLEPSIATYASHTRFLPEERRVPALAEDAMGKFRHAASNLDRALSGRTTLLSSFSTADIVVGSMLSWAGSMQLLTDYAGLARYLDGLKRRPAFVRSHAD
jgi:glutathione S-transferase